MLDKLNYDRPFLFDRKTSCLLYAGDLILLSKTAAGLQKLISANEKFCNKWQVTVNVSKTKIMIAYKRYINDMFLKV